ncbi:MAG: hypothetical protein LBE79_05510 [Tannerella sp.]|jgi:hypothetical protein|nr:hypothetical protein [Tannerella sp.]
MNVLFTSDVSDHIDFLIPFLYELGYFPNKEKSRKYFRELVDNIKKNLPVRQHNPAPPYFYRYLKNRAHEEYLQFASFSKNRNTCWYAFFTIYEDEKTGDNIYLVHYIANNHTVAQYL